MSAGIYETVSGMMPTGQPTLTEAETAGIVKEIDKIIASSGYLEEPSTALRYGILLLQTDEPFHGRNILRHVISSFKGTPQAGVASMYLDEIDKAAAARDAAGVEDEEEVGDAEEIGPEGEPGAIEQPSLPWVVVWNGPQRERVDVNIDSGITFTGIRFNFRFYDPLFHAPEPIFERSAQFRGTRRTLFSRQIFDAFVEFMSFVGEPRGLTTNEIQSAWRRDHAAGIAEYAELYGADNGYDVWKNRDERIIQYLDHSVLPPASNESYVGLDPYETLRPILVESQPGIPVTKLYESGISKGPPKKEENRGTYIWRVEDWDVDKQYGNEPIEMKACYSVIDDSYIGDSKFANQLKKRGIKPQSHSGNDVASIGFSEKEKKWYGWSHRAIYGFGIGDKVKEGDITATSGWTDEYLKDHPDDKPLPIGFKAKTLDDAKKMAIAFASAVS